MARTDSFFIRANVLTNGTIYAQNAIDLGAYVDALGKSVLRIHNVQVQYGVAGESVDGLSPNIQSDISFQLTTQSQVQLVDLDNRSVIASGHLAFAGDATATGTGGLVLLNEVMDAGPQNFTDGYLIAVEQMYLGVDQGVDALSKISIMLECTVETMTQAAAMALALSQQ
tara:strand:+ start:1310 stop:1819 length:510 start_codon:yes stop_codon:yes gene_type:complete